MELVIKIELGNEAMQTKGDVLEALSNSFAKIPPHFEDGADGKIMDHNGNSVGRWEVKGWRVKCIR